MRRSLYDRVDRVSKRNVAPIARESRAHLARDVCVANAEFGIGKAICTAG